LSPLLASNNPETPLAVLDRLRRPDMRQGG
jgi:hypothetical protein